LWCDGSGAVGDPYTEPGNETWCLESQSTVSFGQDATDLGPNDYVRPVTEGGLNYGGQLMQVTEVWLLQGDALACRTCK
jgi:hypothetical protein